MAALTLEPRPLVVCLEVFEESHGVRMDSLGIVVNTSGVAQLGKRDELDTGIFIVAVLAVLAVLAEITAIGDVGFELRSLPSGGFGRSTSPPFAARGRTVVMIIAVIVHRLPPLETGFWWAASLPWRGGARVVALSPTVACVVITDL